MLEGRGRLVTEEETVLEKPGALTTGTTVLHGPMMLLIMGAKYWSGHGGGGGFVFLFLCIMESQMMLDALRYICDFVQK